MLQSNGRGTVLGGIGSAVIGAAAMLAGTHEASASIAATASVSTFQTVAPFNYTVTLHNTGDTNIGTFWFAWTDTPGSYDFLPTSPTNISGPAFWLAPISHNFFPGDGYGIEWYDYYGAYGIAPGGTGTFSFTSNSSPTTLAGNAFLTGFKVTNSVVYMGYPQYDPGYSFVVAVPEPASATLLGCVGIASLSRRLRGRSRTHVAARR